MRVGVGICLSVSVCVFIFLSLCLALNVPLSVRGFEFFGSPVFESACFNGVSISMLLSVYKCVCVSVCVGVSVCLYLFDCVCVSVCLGGCFCEFKGMAIYQCFYFWPSFMCCMLWCVMN